jgi:hypothetical protein
LAVFKKEYKKIIEKSGVLKGLKTQEDVSRLLKYLQKNEKECFIRDVCPRTPGNHRLKYS